jgi:hypothetical protein
MYRWVMIVWVLHWWMGDAAMAQAPWPLKTPAELKALHGLGFSGAHILTYRHTVKPDRPGTAPETVIEIGKGNPLPVVETREEDGETVFSYKGEEALRWRPMGQPLPEVAAARLRHALLWLWPVHPNLAASVSADGKAPQHLVVRTHAAGQSQNHDYQLIKSNWCETCDAIPADAEPTPPEGSSDDGFATDLVPIMIEASAGRFTPVSSDEYLRRTDVALDRGATLEAFLWFIERSLQDGIQRCQPGDGASGAGFRIDWWSASRRARTYRVCSAP